VRLKNILLIPFVIISPIALGQSNLEYKVKELSDQHQFVKMDSLNSKIKGQNYYYYKGLYANVCNDPKLSNEYLDSLKNNPIVDSYEFIRLKNDNYIKSFNYELAYSTSKTLSTKFKKKYSKSELNNEINAQRIWELLRAKPAQYIDDFSNIILATKKDIAGLITTTVTANGVSSDFVFDTGAGISCISESIAIKMGVTLLPDNNITIRSFTGETNKVRIGFASKLQIGELVVHNAVFLVFPDAAFTFANGAYFINGIIGFPIAKELGTITIEKDKIVLAKNINNEPNEKNFFVDQLRAIVMLKFQDKTFPYNFDSGANTSNFNKSFYVAYKMHVDKLGIEEKSTAPGAGGKEITTKVVVLKDQTIEIATTPIKLEKMEIDKKSYGIYGEVNYGNIGQDIIGPFKKVIISFDKNYLKLEN
jgi:predicted aspartyl protease